MIFLEIFLECALLSKQTTKTKKEQCVQIVVSLAAQEEIQALAMEGDPSLIIIAEETISIPDKKSIVPFCKKNIS